MHDYIAKFESVSMKDLGEVGGKNASLGEMYQNLSEVGILVPDGFVVKAKAYWEILETFQLKSKLAKQLAKLDKSNYNNLHEIGESCRSLINEITIPENIVKSIHDAYDSLQSAGGSKISVAVRSSATAEDLPGASFAGQQESFLNISDKETLIQACKQCYVSLFTDRAIKYREENRFQHMEVALSIGIQKMVRSDLGCAGVCFTLDPESGFKDVILISGSWGLGENVVKGNVTPDEFYLFKPGLNRNTYPVIKRNLGSKEKTLKYKSGNTKKILPFDETTQNVETKKALRKQFVLNDEELNTLGKWAIIIEDYYQRPMDIEWAKDGVDGQIYIVQARPETVFSNQKALKYQSYVLKNHSNIICEGDNVGNKIAKGKARVLNSTNEIDQLEEGEVLVTQITNPDWNPLFKKAVAVVTDKGGRTSHAAIVAREMGTVAVVGTGDGTEKIRTGDIVTVSCAEGNTGKIYEGELEWSVTDYDISKLKLPLTKAQFILSDPGQAFKLSQIPNQGVGLMRIEFAIANHIRIHPLALLNFDSLKNSKLKKQIMQITVGYEDKSKFFVDQLSSAIATIAAAFSPKDVIVRFSDFKSNEYRNLIGGNLYEPEEENPMIGWRGASRYVHTLFRPAFELECQAIKTVRDKMGLTNVIPMIPFCRTVEEGKNVLSIMQKNGLKQGENDLKIYLMIEIPSNIILAEDFARNFDGFSIGSNDLTQLTLGISRDSELLNPFFDVKNEAVTKSITAVIKAAKMAGIPIGFCGQAPSDHPDYARFLVKNGIDSISFSPDAIFTGIKSISKAEIGIEEELSAI